MPRLLGHILNVLEYTINTYKFLGIRSIENQIKAIIIALFLKEDFLQNGYDYLLFITKLYSIYNTTKLWMSSSLKLIHLLDLFINNLLSLIGIILRRGFLIWEIIFIYCGLFVLILVVFLGFFVLFLLSLRFGQISPLAFFRWFTTTSDRNDESCNRITCNYCLP